MSRAELAERAQMAAGHLTHLENGNRLTGKFDTVARIADVLGLSLDEIAVRCGWRKTPMTADRSLSKRAADALARVDQGLAELSQLVHREAADIVKRTAVAKPKKS